MRSLLYCLCIHIDVHINFCTLTLSGWAFKACSLSPIYMYVTMVN